METNWRKYGRCPLCNRYYSEKRQRTKHHIFPKHWYCDGTVVYACSVCHTKEFHRVYPMIFIWTPEQCLKKWVNFCKSKGRDAFTIYPYLKQLA